MSDTTSQCPFGHSAATAGGGTSNQDWWPNRLKIELLSQTLTEWLAPMFAADRERLVIWIEKVTPSDVEMDARRMTLLAQQGAVTLNELRQWAGLPELDAFDIPAGQSDSLADAVGRMVDERLRSPPPSRNGHAKPLPSRG